MTSKGDSKRTGTSKKKYWHRGKNWDRNRRDEGLVLGGRIGTRNMSETWENNKGACYLDRKRDCNREKDWNGGIEL